MKMNFIALMVLGILAPHAIAATIAQVLPCGKQGVAGGLGGGTDMQRYTIDNRIYPDAVCNDGTPAVFYFARYTKDADRNKWIIFLQGGGSCETAGLCANRWCSIDTNFGLDKMSSSLTKPSIRANGVLNPRSDNQFGSWNRILVFYCSSDHWSGTGASTVQATVQGKTFSFDLYFRGARIVDAVIDTLRRASNPAKRRGVSDGAITLPDLDQATDVLFAGSSGGGNGARTNGDRIGAKLKATNPSLRYRVAIDAAFGVAPETIDYAHSVPCTTLGVHCSYEETMLSDYNDRDRSFWSAIIEESCLAWHTAHQPGTEWRCADGFHVITNHVTSPFFIHMDEQDSNVGGSYVEQFGTWDMFGQKIEQQLRDLALLNTTAEEGGALATPGAFGPQCTNHESFTNDSAVYDVRVNGLTYESALWNWWSGAQPQVAIHAFSGAGPAADCPK